jgi:hypothetical protein
LAAWVLRLSHRRRFGRGLARAIGRMTIIRSVPRVIDVRQSEAKNDSRSGSQ